MAMSFAGISTGIPTDQLIQSILQQEGAPINRLQARQTANNQKKTVLQSIRTALTGLATSISSLNSASLSARAVTSSDAASVSATAKGAASGSYDISVSQLATKARLETGKSFGSPADDPVGSAGDVYTIVNKDGVKTEIALQDGKTSLADLNDAINAESAESGVSSTIVQTTPGNYRLVLSSTDTGEGKNGGGNIGIFGGASNALGVADNEDDASSYGVATTAAQNAKFTLNGVEIERSSNTITDAVDGVTLTLNKADSSKTINLNVSLDKDSIVKAYQDVVSKFNSAYQAYKNASGKGGIFAGDLSMQSIFSQLRSSLTGVIEEGGNIQGSSATLGLKTERDGTLSLDTKKLEEALKENPDLVGRIFDKASSTTKTFVDSLTASTGGTITAFINGIDNTNSNLSKQIDTIQTRLDRRKELLTAQFARLESLVGQLQAAGQSLSGLY
ncbi:MAG: flagellar filament capping protein FliD [Holophagales bacterium]|jgi:flagellar hook-associated protein 2|nr:flagellar filament capping protein FliD [Holophagales bacterium]